jgi:WD40 repeat protein
VTASREEKAVRLWDLKAGNPALDSIVLRGLKTGVRSLKIGPNGRWLVIAGEHGPTLLCDLTVDDPAEGSAALYDIGGKVLHIEFISQSRLLLQRLYQNGVQLFDLTADTPAAASTVLRGQKEPVWRLAMDPQDRWLVTADSDNIRLWNLTSDNPVQDSIILRGHEGGVSAIAIDPSGRWLVSGSDDKTARLWELRLENLVKKARRAVGRELSQKGRREYVELP